MKTELTLKLKPALAAELRAACRESGTATKELVAQAIAEKLERVRAARWVQNYIAASERRVGVRRGRTKKRVMTPEKLPDYSNNTIFKT